LNRIELSFPENHRSISVIIIGIELLSLACPGLGLGGDYVTSFIMVILILLVWRIRFGVMGMKFVGVMPIVQGFVRCDAGSLSLVIILKSKDRFVERPPMKIVQP
jgi:hypothetical protein